MIVKINGSAFDTERVMRFAPHKKDGLEQRCEKMAKMPTQQVKTVDRMGWRFVLLKDIYGNTFPQCFAPLSGELEYLQE